jgi:hypothetical protein
LAELSEVTPSPNPQELRVASDTLMTVIEQLTALEGTKRALRPGTSEFVELAARIKELARAALEQTKEQHALAERTQEAVAAGEEPPEAIDDVPPRPMDQILGEWRDAERRLSASEADTAEHDLAAGDVRRLRDEYRRAHEAASADAPA